MKSKWLKKNFKHKKQPFISIQNSGQSDSSPEQIRV